MNEDIRSYLKSGVLRFHDTMSNGLLTFEPRDQNKIGVYVCGPTVYDHIHVGNARPLVVYDTIVRLLRQIYGKDNVIFVRNITDVDDKIIDRAHSEGREINDLTADMTREFRLACQALNCRRPDHEPRATDHIDDMISVITTLVAKDMAYIREDHVFFDVAQDKGYGRLTSAKGDETQQRIETQSIKKHSQDFVLWKPSNQDSPGWQSPWGYGRPGWHIECSAMSHHFLDIPFDIHGGGQDLIFPHHENEIAQSCAAFGCNQMARYWIHNGMVTLNDQKMSKSLGNFLTVQQTIENHSGSVLRLTLLQSHYRGPCAVNNVLLIAARNTLDRWYQVLLEEGWENRKANVVHEKSKAIFNAEKTFYHHLADDFDTPQALACISSIIVSYREAAPDDKPAWCQCLYRCGSLLGLLVHDPQEWFQCYRVGYQHRQSPTRDEITQMIAHRNQSRNEGRYQDADRIRNQLLADGISLLDDKAGTRWQREIPEN